MELVKLHTNTAAPEDLADTLRKLADRVDAGEVKSVCTVADCGQSFEYTFGTRTYQDEVLLCTLLQARAVRRFQES